MSEDAIAALDAATGSWDWSGGVSYNSALVFIKPHAATDPTKELVRSTLEAKGLTIDFEGSIDHAAIESGGIIDKHYAAIANYAMNVDTADLKIPDSKLTEFAEKYEIAWHAALQAGKLVNAAKAMEIMAQDGKGLGHVWAAAPEKFKLGPGLYVAKCKYVMGENDDGDTVGLPPGEDDGEASELFIINGFYAGMRQMFVTEGAIVHYYVVGFTSDKVTWADFRDKIIGPTDPASAPGDSLRGMIYRQWEALEHSAEPTVSMNGVHASAGPLEGLKERMVWLDMPVDMDPFGQKALDVLWSEGASKVKAFLENSEVEFAGKKGPIFDVTECMESIQCLCALNNIAFSSPSETRDWYGVEEAEGEVKEGGDDDENYDDDE